MRRLLAGLGLAGLGLAGAGCTDRSALGDGHATTEYTDATGDGADATGDTAKGDDEAWACDDGPVGELPPAVQPGEAIWRVDTYATDVVFPRASDADLALVTTQGWPQPGQFPAVTWIDGATGAQRVTLESTVVPKSRFRMSGLTVLPCRRIAGAVSISQSPNGVGATGTTGSPHAREPWVATSGPPSWSSGAIATEAIDGQVFSVVRTVVGYTHAHPTRMIAFDPDDGSLLWEAPVLDGVTGLSFDRAAPGLLTLTNFEDDLFPRRLEWRDPLTGTVLRSVLVPDTVAPGGAIAMADNGDIYLQTVEAGIQRFHRLAVDHDDTVEVLWSEAFTVKRPFGYPMGRRRLFADRQGRGVCVVGAEDAAVDPDADPDEFPAPFPEIARVRCFDASGARVFSRAYSRDLALRNAQLADSGDLYLFFETPVLTPWRIVKIRSPFG